MFQNRDRKNAIVTGAFRNLAQIGIDTTHSRKVWAILPQFREWLYYVTEARSWKVWKMVQIACADFQKTSVRYSFRYASVHPRFELGHSLWQSSLSRAI